MSEKTPTDLPMIGTHPIDEDVAACSPKNYVSNEEKAILDAMRRLHEQAIELRSRMDAAATDDERKDLESELAELRGRREELAVRRERAYRNKMITLGHIPPDDDFRLF